MVARAQVPETGHGCGQAAIIGKVGGETQLDQRGLDFAEQGTCTAVRQE